MAPATSLWTALKMVFLLLQRQTPSALGNFHSRADFFLTWASFTPEFDLKLDKFYNMTWFSSVWFVEQQTYCVPKLWSRLDTAGKFSWFWHCLPPSVAGYGFSLPRGDGLTSWDLDFLNLKESALPLPELRILTMHHVDNAPVSHHGDI